MSKNLNIIEDKGITVLFDEARAVRDMQRYKDTYENDVKRIERYNRIRIPAVILATLTFAFIAYFMCWENTYAAEGRGAYLMFAYVISAFGWILIKITNKPVKSLKERYNWNIWFYLFQKDKKIVGAEVREHPNGETCELYLRKLTLEDYIVTEIFNVREHSLKNPITEDFYFKKRYVKGIENITVDIIKGEVQFPCTEQSERTVVTNE